MGHNSEMLKGMIRDAETIIQAEFESIQIQKKLIIANQPGHFNLNKIIVRDAKLYIEGSKESIKIFMGLKAKWQQLLESGNDIHELIK